MGRQCVAIQIGFVADTRNAKHPGAAVTGNGDFRYGGHSNGIGSDRPQET